MSQGGNNRTTDEPGVSGLDISGIPVEGGARLPSPGAGNSDQVVLDLINFLEWLAPERPDFPERFDKDHTYEDIAWRYLQERGS